MVVHHAGAESGKEDPYIAKYEQCKVQARNAGLKAAAVALAITVPPVLYLNKYSARWNKNVGPSYKAFFPVASTGFAFYLWAEHALLTCARENRSTKR
ncbi:hypothetical protein PROFUN_02291 [Planoprotostelium fungivorum]|uniref:Uncharacterized protein n=1 Tax=Planoprotostelium fungivorum TaxID=1890364 RepID=A0A2P6NYH5_9EUKA|nr:hypothetical protein PROFUN_02291 [Planoprotostelium fungivorum]